jgi:hypothetical protein
MKSIEKKYKSAVNERGFSIYEYIKTSRNTYKNSGFDYENRIFEKTVSPILMAKGTKSREILLHLERVIYYLIQSVKNIKMFVNYAEPQTHKKIN